MNPDPLMARAITLMAATHITAVTASATTDPTPSSTVA
jgi:hypothetical protein